MTLHVSIITPELQQDLSNISHISLPTLQGEIGIYPGHIDIVTVLKEGKMYREEDKLYESIDLYKDHTKTQHIPGGIAYVTKDHVTIITSESTTI